MGGLNPRWVGGYNDTHSLSLKAATPQTPKKSMNKSGKTLIFIFYPYYLCIFSISAAVLTCKMCTNRHLSFVFWSKPYSGGCNLRREICQKKEVAFWRVSYSCTHGGPRSKGCNHRMKIFLHQNSLFILLPPPQMSLCCDPFRKLVTSKILSELRVPISTSLKSTFSTGCNFSTNAIRFCRTVKNLLNEHVYYLDCQLLRKYSVCIFTRAPNTPTIISMPVFRKQHCN